MRKEKATLHKVFDDLYCTKPFRGVLSYRPDEELRWWAKKVWDKSWRKFADFGEARAFVTAPRPEWRRWEFPKTRAK